MRAFLKRLRKRLPELIGDALLVVFAAVAVGGTVLGLLAAAGAL